MNGPDRIPAPKDIGDIDMMLLPGRACVLSVRDTLVEARRSALADATNFARAQVRRDAGRDLEGAATLSCFWEATSCLELAANVAAPWVDPQLTTENGAWVEMTRYDPGRATRFYESSHKWSEDRYAVLSGHVFQKDSPDTLLDALEEAGLVDPSMLSAYTEAQAATASFLRRQFQHLAKAWKQFRGYAAAYEHGLLIVPEAVGEVVDDHGEVITHTVVTFETRRDRAMGNVGEDAAPGIEWAKEVGELAIDVAWHVADSRLRMLEALEVEDNQVYLRPWQNPFPYWFSRGDVSDETLELLERNVTLAWVRVEDDEPRDDAP